MSHFTYKRFAVVVALTAMSFALTAGGAAAYPLEPGERGDNGVAPAHVDPQLQQALRVDAVTSPEAARAVSGRVDFTTTGSANARGEIAPADRALLLRQPPSLPTAVPASSGDGFDWVDAGIGAVGALGLVLVLAGASAIGFRRRRVLATG
jgi:hypothetical protein